ncbi:MAG: polysaccharide export protein [Clostridia bacterium]|nr:polysaccharide export protein [Clostridia bacterium]
MNDSHLQMSRTERTKKGMQNNFKSAPRQVVAMDQAGELQLVENRTDDDELEIDLIALMYRLLENALWIILTSVILAVIAGLITVFLIKPKYSATSGLYVVNRQDSAINLSDLQIGSSLTSDYSEVFSNWHVQETVLQRLGLDYTYDALEGMISLKNPTNTRILYITATSISPDEAKVLADTYAQVAREFIAATMDTQQPSIFMEALWPSKPSSPNLIKNIVIGFAAGFVLSCGIVLLTFLVDDRVRNSEDVEKYLSIPILGMMPEQKAGRQNRRVRNQA